MILVLIVPKTPIDADPVATVPAASATKLGD
jgi:hypothetical protein